LGRIEALAMFYINNLGKIIGSGVAGLFAAEVISCVSKSKSFSHAADPREEETNEELINPFRKLADAGNWDVFSAAVLKAIPDYSNEEIMIIWNELRKKK